MQTSGGGGEAAVVAHKGREFVSDRERGGDVDGVKGAQVRRREIGRGFENPVIDPDQGDAGEDFGGAPAVGGRGAPAAEGSQDFDSGEGARRALRVPAQGREESRRFSLPATILTMAEESR